MRVEKTEQLYEGKAKKVYGTTEETLCIVSYKDDATAFKMCIRDRLRSG